MAAFISCRSDREPPRPSLSARVGDDPRDLRMLIPMAKATGEPLVDLKAEIPSLHIDLRYATVGNVSGRRLYDPSMPAMLDAPTARKLAKAQAALLAQGHSLKIWDAYRPPEAHLRLWKLSGKSGYVADPRLGWSKHCSARAVDVTLVDPASGAERPMPSKFDDFSSKAASAYSGGDPVVAANARTLRLAMLDAGFAGIDIEWWHFENASRFGENLPPVFADEAGVRVP